MRFGRKKQGVVKAPFEIGLERRYSCCVNWLEAGSAAGKTGELRPVAGGRDDKRPVLSCDSYGLCPELKRFEAEIENKLFRALGLAPGRQHAARKTGTAETWTFALFQHFNSEPGLGAFKSNSEARNSGADNANMHGLTHLHGRLAGHRQKRRERASL